MLPYCFIDGEIQEYKNARISPGDIGVLRGFAVFDFFRVYNRIPFYFDNHFERLKKSAELYDLRLNIDKSGLLDAVDKLCTKNNCSNAHVRVVLTGGETVNGIEPSKSRLIVLFEEFKEFPKEFFDTGVKIITFSHQRSYPQAKTSQYIEAVLLQKRLKEENAIEILYLDDDIVRECSTSNIFIVKNHCLITPSDEILNGITRESVINLAKNNGINIDVREIKIQELFEADEVFLTATNKKVMPIVKIDNKMVCDGRVGDLTKKLMDLYNEEIKSLTGYQIK